MSTARVAVAAIFLVNGAVFANWVARIPEIQQKLGLNNATLGVALLGGAVGALLAMPLTGWLVARFGSRLMTQIAGLIYCTALPLLALAPNLPRLTLALVVFGALNGAMDVSMNAQGIVVEQRYHRPIMSSFHGMFSVGGMVGAGGGGIAASLGIKAFPHLLGTAIMLGMIVIWASRYLVSTTGEDITQEPVLTLPSGPLFKLGIIAFCVLFGEGAIADWSAIYLRRTLETGPGLAAAGYAVFSLNMAVCRFGGDAIANKLGAVKVVRFGGTIAAVGLGLSLIIAQPVVALLGFASVGIGLSCIVPLVVSAAGRTPGIAPSLALATVATTGYCGFLCGPPLIGFVADLFTLRIALGMVVTTSAIAALLARTVEVGKRN